MIRGFAWEYLIKKKKDGDLVTPDEAQFSQ
jgi:macrodomain Ter protein organizer (MatP/YcbG family)